MLNHQNSNTCLAVEAHQKLHKALHALRIHLAHRLVQNQKSRPGNKNRRQRQTLPLAAAQLVDTVILKAAQAYQLQGFANLACDNLRLLALIFQRKANLIRHCHRKKLIIRRLVHSAHQLACFFRRPFADILALQVNCSLQLAALLAAQQAADSFNQRRLAAAAATCQKQHFTVRQRQVDIF